MISRHQTTDSQSYARLNSRAMIEAATMKHQLFQQKVHYAGSLHHRRRLVSDQFAAIKNTKFCPCSVNSCLCYLVHVQRSKTG